MREIRNVKMKKEKQGGDSRKEKEIKITLIKNILFFKIIIKERKGKGSIEREKRGKEETEWP